MKDFAKLKKDKKLTIEKFAERPNEIKVTRKQFDGDSGEELEPVVDIYIKENLQKRKEELQKELATVNAILSEFQ